MGWASVSEQKCSDSFPASMREALSMQEEVRALPKEICIQLKNNLSAMQNGLVTAGKA